MKKLNLLSAFVVCLAMVSFTASATGNRTEFKEFKINSVDDIIVGKKVEAIWTLSYSTSETPITVVKRKTVDGCEYLVNSKHFELSYKATSNGFGAKEVRKSWSNVPKKISSAVINQEQLKRQEIITQSKVDDDKALELIASFLPDLINDDYTHLLN